MLELKAEKRNILGRKVKQLRKNGLVPAELYGHGFENVHLSLPDKDFLKVYEEAGEHAIINIVFEGDSRAVLIHDVVFPPMTNEVLSVDLYQVRMDEKVKAAVPLEFENESPVVKEKQAILVKNMDEIEVEALPADLPDMIKVDLSRLVNIDESIYVKDLPKSSKFDFAADPEMAIVSVVAPEEEKVEEEITPEQVVVEGEEKAAEEGGEGGEEAVSKGGEPRPGTGRGKKKNEA